MSFPFSCIAFDLDGTIADTAPDIAAALNHALTALGRSPLPLAEVRSMIGNGTHVLLQLGLAATGGSDEASVERGYPILIDYYAAHIAVFTRAYPGIEAAMDQLAHRGVALALCTNKPEAAARQLVDSLGLHRRFAAIVGGDTLGVTKPDPAMLHLAIERAGGGRAALVGDSIIDMQTAAAAGVPGIAVSFGYRDRPLDQLGATATIDDFGELVGVLGAVGER